MKISHSGSLFYIGILLAWAGLSSAEVVDPVSPAQWHQLQAEENKALPRWLPTRIRQLEAEREELLQQIALLPRHNPMRLSDHLGYHSAIAVPDENGVFSSHRLEISLLYPHRIHSIALVPAFNPLESNNKTYAFPKRFKIEVQEANGRWKNGQWIQETDGWTEVVNWLDEDFPDPGPYPVFFSGIDLNSVTVRMTVPGGAAYRDDAFFALGEMYVFKTIEGRFSDNLSVWTFVKFKSSSSISMPPLWDLRYLHDGLSGLGLPLGEERIAADDFMVRFTAEKPSREDPVRIMLDLGQSRKFGRLDIWPTEAPHQIAMPLFGFPGRIRVEFSNDPGFNKVHTILVENTREQMYHDNLLQIQGLGYEARYVRLTLEKLHKYMGQRILGIGEVTASRYGRAYPIKKVIAEGIPEADLDQLQRLIDGTCRQRRILSEPEWINGLARRRPLDRRLVVVERELGLAQEAWRVLVFRASIWAGCLLCTMLLSAMGLQRLQRRRILKRLKTRITRDLHDEVGSGLGGISLKSGVLEGLVSDEVVKKELGDLSLMAREISASLREVVWMLDQDRILLPALINKLVERAERVLRGVQLSVEQSSDLPDMEVSLSCKRHIVMFFKEAVHNCARHAKATEVTVSVQVDVDRFLRVSVRDNGCGFEPSERRCGWGLENMSRRAEELRGKLELHSAPDEGTIVRLILSLDMLSREPTKAYKTSN